ncbi:MAG: FtsX-like permease family protein, partial [Gemmatimonadota bacterium]
RSAAFIGVLVMVAALLAGGAPAALAARTPLMEALKSGAREGGGRRRALRSALVVAQGTLSVILLVGAGLFVQSFTRASTLELGFAPDGIIVAAPDHSSLARTPEEHEARWRRREAAVRAIPGVTGAAQTVTIPFESQWVKGVVLHGDTLPPLAGGGPYVNAVSADYFRVMGTPIVRGRDFTPQDREGTAPVAIINERMARLVWPGKDPLGECFNSGESDGCMTVIGIVPDARINALADEPPPHFFQPLGQWTPGMRSLVVRSSLAGEGGIDAVRRALVQAEPSLPYVAIRPMMAIVDEQLQPWRLGATLFALFGALGLAVAALGLYSVIAHDVAQRSREIGVRLALGARRWDVARLVLSGGMLQALAGVALGIAAAWVVSRRVADLLFETKPHDPVIYGVVVAVLLLVALAASLVPARRATQVEPTEVLRGE